MNRIYLFLFPVFIWIHIWVNPLFAQSDSNLKKEKLSNSTVIDSEKNIMLSSQSEEFQNVKSESDWQILMRLLELKNEMLSLGTSNNSKKQATF